ncbi:DUF2490 domain-containing protein [Algoriphagus boritolerans]|uniref:DUF2490 domain-containing protein n=1 Tax=Algoriphagus boritolerans DSM 17298 = JCM 18970 TaxID=1120964 RepID=A0A1H5SB18_9BACT|nr:DUF2490 domain-containing protein [Algoriphagus boritolerans]SEF47610.1 Protein of unknown function [Algoriphagus boritolerans DSM 17298 = JCM 18970]
MKKLCISILLFSLQFPVFAQEVPDLGSWYMYFGNFRFAESPWAIHGEAQYRDNKILGDLEQLLLRTGLQYNLKSGQVSFLAGYASITTGIPGEATETFHENRIYQEVIFRQSPGRVGLMHRYRYEQRWIEGLDLRTRFRYAIFINVPLNKKDLAEKGAVYAQIYDEIFINGEKPTENSQFFDRNRIYLGIGYRTSPRLALQFGLMEQTSNSLSKTQLQFSAFHQLISRKSR